MPIPVVACAQQQMRLFESLEAYQKELSRFFYMVRAKGADLVVFPALSGLMAVAPQVDESYERLLRNSGDRGFRSLLDRTRHMVTGGAAALLRSNYRRALGQVLSVDGQVIESAYERIYGGLAGSYRVTVIAGSLYLPDDAGVLRHRCTVFGPDGKVIGYHDAAILSELDSALAEPAAGWEPIDTPVGRVGIMMGQEALYPEVARLLTHKGADLLVTLSATTDETEADYLRQAAIARALDNLVFGVSSFLVGANFVTSGEGEAGTYVGRSGIYAPLEMTPRHTGVLVEMGTAVSEGLLTAEMDTAAAHSLWESSTAAVRRAMPAALFAGVVPQLYQERPAEQPEMLPVPPERGLLTAGTPEPTPELGEGSEGLEPAVPADETGGWNLPVEPGSALPARDWEPATWREVRSGRGAGSPIEPAAEQGAGPDPEPPEPSEPQEHDETQEPDEPEDDDGSALRGGSGNAFPA